MRIKPITEERIDYWTLVGNRGANHANVLKVWCAVGCYSQRCRHIYERDAVLAYVRNHQPLMGRRNRSNPCKCAAAGKSSDCLANAMEKLVLCRHHALGLLQLILRVGPHPSCLPCECRLPWHLGGRAVGL